MHRVPYLIKFTVLVTSLLTRMVLGNAALKESVQLETGTKKCTFHFDPKRIRKSQVEVAVQLGPFIDAPGLHYPLEACENSTPYRNCSQATAGGLDFRHNALVSLKKARKEIQEFEKLTPPSGLAVAFRYLKREGDFQYWLQKTRYDFLLSGDAYHLKKKFRRLDPALLCENEFKKLTNAKSEVERWRIASVDWQTCLNTSFRKKYGEYPKSDWNRFLDENGIEDRCDSTENA